MERIRRVYRKIIKAYALRGRGVCERSEVLSLRAHLVPNVIEAQLPANEVLDGVYDEVRWVSVCCWIGGGDRATW